MLIYRRLVRRKLSTVHGAGQRLAQLKIADENTARAHLHKKARLAALGREKGQLAVRERKKSPTRGARTKSSTTRGARAKKDTSR